MSHKGIRWAALALLGAGLCGLVACESALRLWLDELGLPINVAGGLQAEFIVNHAEYPTALAFAPDGRVFYTEKNTGRIRVVSGGQLLETPFAEVPVNTAEDRGLLGVAVHPNFALNGRVYVFYTRSNTGQNSSAAEAVIDHRIVYFVAAGDAADGGEVFVASIPAEGDGRRVGGRIAFAPDGTLFAAVGDQGNVAAAQDTTRLSGKILRYNDDGTIPASNPIANSPVYAHGLRDPQGLAFDPLTGAGFVIDRNLVNSHEINRIVAGRDFGWSIVIGPADNDIELAYVQATPEYAEPVHHSDGDFDAFVGLAFNPSTKYGNDARNGLFCGIPAKNVVQWITLGGDDHDRVNRVRDFAGGFPSAITDVAFTPAGTLYVACQDAILRVVRFP